MLNAERKNIFLSFRNGEQRFHRINNLIIDAVNYINYFDSEVSEARCNYVQDIVNHKIILK